MNMYGYYDRYQAAMAREQSRIKSMNKQYNSQLAAQIKNYYKTYFVNSMDKKMFELYTGVTFLGVDTESKRQYLLNDVYACAGRLSAIIENNESVRQAKNNIANKIRKDLTSVTYNFIGYGCMTVLQALKKLQESGNIQGFNSVLDGMSDGYYAPSMQSNQNEFNALGIDSFAWYHTIMNIYHFTFTEKVEINGLGKDAVVDVLSSFGQEHLNIDEQVFNPNEINKRMNLNLPYAARPNQFNNLFDYLNNRLKCYNGGFKHVCGGYGKVFPGISFGPFYSVMNYTKTDLLDVTKLDLVDDELQEMLKLAELYPYGKEIDYNSENGLDMLLNNDNLVDNPITPAIPLHFSTFGVPFYYCPFCHKLYHPAKEQMEGYTANDGIVSYSNID